MRDNCEALLRVATEYLSATYGPSGAAMRLYGAADEMATQAPPLIRPWCGDG